VIAAANERDCEPGVAIGFFNGVQTTPDQALNAIERMRGVYKTTSPKGEPIEYELFYNNSKGLSNSMEGFRAALESPGWLVVEAQTAKAA
jgi:hypothetical protein